MGALFYFILYSSLYHLGECLSFRHCIGTCINMFLAEVALVFGQDHSALLSHFFWNVPLGDWREQVNEIHALTLQRNCFEDISTQSSHVKSYRFRDKAPHVHLSHKIHPHRWLWDGRGNIHQPSVQVFSASRATSIKSLPAFRLQFYPHQHILFIIDFNVKMNVFII